MIKVVDARTGDEVKVGDAVEYPDGTGWKLVSVSDKSFFTATAIVHSIDEPGAVPLERAQPLAVRFFHPAFFLQRVGFFPS